jgi:hypothetical protein
VRKIFAIILPVFLLAACHLPYSISGTATATANPHNCYFNWASLPLPDLSAKVQAAINAAALTDVRVTAEAYGENCYDSQTNKPVSFSTLEADFYFTVKVVNLTDQSNLGNLLEKILHVLDTIPPGKIPGPQPGKIAVSFQAGNQQLNISFTVTAGKSARLQGLHEAGLFEKLQHK